MKNALWVKFIAVLLCAACLLAALGSGVMLGILTSLDWLKTEDYLSSLESTIREQLSWSVEWMASAWASREYGKMPEQLFELQRETGPDFGFSVNWDDISYEIQDGDNKVLCRVDNQVQPVLELRYTFSPLEYEEYLGSVQIPQEEDADAQWGAVSDGAGGRVCYAYHEKTLDTPLVVKISLGENGVQLPVAYELVGMFAGHGVALMLGMALGLVLFAALAVFLCSVAGRKPDSTEIKAGGFNALPLDLYGGGVLASCIALGYLAVEVIRHAQDVTTVLAAMLLLGYGGCVLFVCFCFAVAAQVKMGNWHWLRNSIVGRCTSVALEIIRGIFHLIPTLWSFALRIVKDIFKVISALAVLLWSWMKKCLTVTGRLLKKCLVLCEKTLSLLPLTWQWIVVGGVLALMLPISFANDSKGCAVLWGIASLTTILYGANCFGRLLEGAKRMRSGDLESKVDDKYLVGCFREFAGELNGLADVAMVAARNQLKSERMKTELITNVSHDIKTPLTSIINYVDLLEKPHTEEEQKAYVEVLSRQSQRLKKLIDDLMEMSKASTGNIQVDIGEIDAVEAVTQALGEFADKLTAAGLTPVFHQSEENIMLLADGRLLWRAMSNVLSNAVKYALPGTRLYVDVSATQDKAIISFKNISGAQLNISAEELMERFVRGDSSRNTEGSGLGLNIAKSLMELQKGQLQLLVDGDLFKVTLVFPRAT
jgi:signal transduction histidine kinase